MAKIEPFRGIYYDSNVVGSLDGVVAPPYDVISPAQLHHLEKTHPANVVRLILPGGEDPYGGSARLMAKWLAEGILKRLESEAIFVYEQIFQHAGRRFCRGGVIARLRLEDPATGNTFGHEKTLSGPKEDRLRLLRQVKCNLSPVFGLVPDRKGLFKLYLHRGAEGRPLLNATFDGIQNQVFAVTDPADIASMTESLASEPVFIADGHHRYETALNYHVETAGRLEADGPTAYVMTMLVPMTDSGLIILPTHRIVKSSLKGSELLTRMEKQFILERIRDDSAQLAGLGAQLARITGRPAIGVYTSEGAWVAVLRPDVELTNRVAGKSPEWHCLDVTVLHLAIIEDLLGIPFERIGEAEEITYTRDGGQVRAAVDRGEAAAGFLLRATPIEAVKRVGGHRELMPPKSTFFYPKLLTGLVFNALDE